MLNLFGKFAGLLGSGLESLALWLKAKERSEAEETGALKQRAEDRKNELLDTRDQLKEAIEHEDGDWRRAADRGRF